MKIIVGLGNFGAEYQETRHNVGFMFLDALAEAKELTPVGESLTFGLNKKFEALVAETKVSGEKIVLVKPQTYMNSSGRAVSKILDFFKAEASDLIVINDDKDLPLGRIRIRKDGGSAGQKGLQNIIDSIGNAEFTRIRIGISNPEQQPSQGDTANFVLDNFSKREKPVIEETISSGVSLLVTHLCEGSEIPAQTLGE